MSNKESIRMTSEDFRSVASRLQQFRQGLAAGEQAALDELLQEALIMAAGDSEVSGYDITTLPVPAGDLLTAFGAR